ncbi:excitatory amino acid transporter 3-like [Spinachia spinachia]
METAIEDGNSRSCRGRTKKCYDFVLRNKRPASWLAVCVLGISLGLILKFTVPMTMLGKEFISFPGEIVIRFIQAITISLIVSTIITGFSVFETSKKVELRAAAVFLSTTLLSVASGFILVMLIEPGVTYGKTGETADIEQSFAIVGNLLDIVWNIVPNDLIASCFQHHESEMREFEIEADNNSGPETNPTQARPLVYVVEGTNMLGLIFWSFVFGLIFHNIGTKGENMKVFFSGLSIFSKSWLNASLSYLPFAVLLMVSGEVIEFQDWEIIPKLGKFIAAVLAGLSFHGAVVLPLIYFSFAKRNPCTVVRKVYPALLSAFLHSSSSATLPLTLQRCEEELGVDRRISRFMLPIGTKISRNGTALYQVIAVVFIAQLSHIHLNASQLITIFVLVVVIAGAEGISSSWSVTTFFVLTAVGLPAEGTAILVVVDWLINHCNKVVNAFGNCISVALIHEVSKNDLEEMMELEEIGSNAEALHQDDIELNICSQASGDSLNTQPEDP